jgi:predicted nuclease of predicted toxin-antitoxin system
MSRPKFLADHDLNEHIVAGVIRRAPSAEFRRVREIGLQDHPDAEVLEYAVAHGFIVVSHDMNTMPAAAYDRVAAGKPVAGLLMVQ